MVADTDSQKTLLGVHIEMKDLDADMVRHHLEKDNDVAIRQLIDQSGVSAVLRPKNKRPSADKSTSLHTAAKYGAQKCLKLLLHPPPSTEDLEAPDMNGQTALLNAVEKGYPEILKMLLKAGASVNVRGDNRLGALHLLVLAISSSEDGAEQRRLLEVVGVLLSPDHVKQLDLESHTTNIAGLTHATALAAAVAKLQKGNGRTWEHSLKEFCKKMVQVGASLSERVGSDTIEQVIIQNRWLTTEELKQRQPAHARPLAAQVVDEVYMGGSNVSEVLKDKKKDDAKEAVNSRVGEHRLLFYAVNINDDHLVNVLMKYGADPWKKELTGELPLHCAAAKGHFDIFDKLLKKMKEQKNTKTIDLRDHTTSLVRKIMESTCLNNPEQKRDHMACLHRLLEDDILLNLNQELVKKTPLHVAADFNNQEAVSKIVQAGAYLGSLNEDQDPILDKIQPATIERAMDGCIRHHCMDDKDTLENIVSEDYTLDLDYRFLIPPQQGSNTGEPQPVNEMKTLMDMCRSRRHRRVIKHPLVQSLLYAKWRKALPLYLTNVFIYLFFVVVLTVFVYFLKDLRLMEQRLLKLHNNGTTNATLEAKIDSQQNSVIVLMVLLLPTWLFILVREIFQIIYSREFYLKSIENYLEWFLLVVVVILCSANLSVDATRHLAAWAMIVAWYEFVLVLGRAPSLALYITMLREVSWNFLKLVFLFGALILSFTISFNIILQPSGDNENEDFGNFWTTLPKAIVMSTGEFEYSDLSEKFPKTMLMTSAVLVFLVFLFLIFLVLMNVMNGLAVTDTQKVVDDAKLYSLTSRLELVYLVETFFLRCPFIKSSCMGHIQLLSGTSNSAILRAKINSPKKDERLWSGATHETHSKLDSDSTEALRLHRQQYLEEKQGKQLEAAVQDLAANHPDMMRSLAEALRSKQ